MEPRQATAERGELLLAQELLGAGKHFVLFEAYVVMQQASQLCSGFFDRLLRFQRRLEICNLGPNLRMLGQESHEQRFLLHPNVPRPRRQQHLFLLAKMLLAGLLPKSQELSQHSFQSPTSLCCRLLERAPDEQRLHQCEVVVLAQRMEC